VEVGLTRGFVDDGSHLALDAAFSQLLFEHLADARIFVFILDLIAAQFNALGSAP
jgi:hypothetical protein